MIVALMQPTFLPWQGYFALIGNVDHFVFLDDFQFVRRSFMHRNRLFVARGVSNWVSIPVEHNGRIPINEARPSLEGFKRKFLTTLRHGYGDTPGLAALGPQIDSWIGGNWTNLADLNIAFIEMASKWLGFQPVFHRSSSLPAPGRRSIRLANILRELGARTYLSARGSFDYMLEDAVFPLPDVETVFQNFEPQPYAQAHAPEFVPNLSILDALLQVGPTQARELVNAGQKGFVPWREMLAAHRPFVEEVADDQSY